jgi:hypothetical protein
LPFVCIGLFATLSALNVIPSEDSQFNAPRTVVAGTGLVFLLPFNWWAFYSGKGPLVVKIFVVIMDGALVVALGALAYQALRALKYGASRLRFERFPFFMGEELTVHWSTGRSLGGFRQVTFTLRCIEQETVVTQYRSSGKSRSDSTIYSWHPRPAARRRSSGSRTT